jgi:hypothetical protein
MMSRIVRFFGICALLLTVCACQSPYVTTPGSVNLKISVDAPAGSAKAIAPHQSGVHSAAKGITTLNAGTVTSFTPDSIQLTLASVDLDETLVYQSFGNSASGMNPPSQNEEAEIISNQTITLQPGSNTLSLNNTYTLPANAPTKFGGITLAITQNNSEYPNSPSIIVSGSFSLNNTTYTVSNLSLPVGDVATSLNMPSVIDTSTGAVPIVQVVFDLDNSILAVVSDSMPDSSWGLGWVQLPTASNIWLLVNPPLIFSPYVGATAPTVQKYEVDITDPTNGLQFTDQWYLNLVTYFEGSNMAGAAYNIAVKPGATNFNNFHPGMLYYPRLSLVSTGVWDIGSMVYKVGPTANIEFPAFSLGGGTGVIYYLENGGNGPTVNLNYTATQTQ